MAFSKKLLFVVLAALLTTLPPCCLSDSSRTKRLLNATELVNEIVKFMSLEVPSLEELTAASTTMPTYVKTASAGISFPVYNHALFVKFSFNDWGSLMAHLLEIYGRPPPMMKTSGKRLHHRLSALLALGSEHVVVPLAVDTGSQLCWWMDRSSYFRNKSSTYEEIKCYEEYETCGPYPSDKTGCREGRCKFLVTYGDVKDNTAVAGVLSKDQIQLNRRSAYVDDEPFSKIIFFGYAQHLEGLPQDFGVLGFGPGHYSLPSQLRARNYQMCIPTVTSSVGDLVQFNYTQEEAEIGGVTAVATMGLVAEDRLSFYIITNFKGLIVDYYYNIYLGYYPVEYYKEVIVDTGAYFSTLPRELYDVLTLRFAKIMAETNKHMYQLDDNRFLCYGIRYGDPTPIETPSIKIKFDNGVLDLKPEQIFFVREFIQGSCPTPRPCNQTIVKHCLAFEAQDATLTLIGYHQLQTTRLFFDLEAKTLMFQKDSCK